MSIEMHVEGIGTMRPLNHWQVMRLRSVPKRNKPIATVAYSLGMSVPQFKGLSEDEKRECAETYQRMMLKERM